MSINLIGVLNVIASGLEFCILLNFNIMQNLNVETVENISDG